MRVKEADPALRAVAHEGLDLADSSRDVVGVALDGDLVRGRVHGGEGDRRAGLLLKALGR